MKKTTLTAVLPYLYALIPIAVYQAGQFSWYTALAAPIFAAATLLALFLAYVVYRKQEQNELLNRLFMGLIVFSLVVLVQNTGWLFSSFLFTLYLASVAIAILFTPFPALVLLGVLTVLFLPSVNPDSQWYDLLHILVLYTSLPLSVFFSSELLKYKENEKKILILKDERDKYETELQRLESNKLFWNDLLLRHSLVTARNYALYWSSPSKSKKLPPKLKRDLERTAQRLDTALADIKGFEEKHFDKTYL